jgi:uncharacterized protein
VAFIIPHLGSFADDWRAQQAFIDPLSRHPNVYTDTSGVRRFDLLLQAVRRAGPGKVLFGSDGPWLHPGLELLKVRALGLPPAAEHLVLGKTFLRLISRSSGKNLAIPTDHRPQWQKYAKVSTVSLKSRNPHILGEDYYLNPE